MTDELNQDIQVFNTCPALMAMRKTVKVTKATFL